MGNCPGQQLPSNQPTLYLSRPLSRCLDSLPPHHLNPYYNSSLHDRNCGHMPSCIGSMVVTISLVSRSVSRGNGVSPVLGSWWIHLANHIPWVFSNRCHTLRQGRLHLSSDDRSRLR